MFFFFFFFFFLLWSLFMLSRLKKNECRECAKILTTSFNQGKKGVNMISVKQAMLNLFTAKAK